MHSSSKPTRRPPGPLGLRARALAEAPALRLVTRAPEPGGSPTRHALGVARTPARVSSTQQATGGRRTGGGATVLTRPDGGRTQTSHSCVAF